MTDRVGLARVYIVWPTPRHFTPEDAALDVLGHVLAGGKTSRLYRALVREKQIAQDVQAYQDGQELTSEFAIVATIRPGHTIAEVEAAIAEELDRIKAEPPTAEEMERAVNTFEARLVRSLESVSEFGGRADRLNLYNVYTGDPGYMAKDFARYGKRRRRQGHADGQAIPGSRPRGGRGRTGERGFDSARSAGSCRSGPRANGQELPFPYGRGAGGEGVPPLSLWERGSGVRARHASRCRRPPPSRSSACRPSSGPHFPTACNCCWSRSTNCRWSICTSFSRAGRANDGQQTPGLAEMTAAVWDEGTAKRSAEEIASELGEHGRQRLGLRRLGYDQRAAVFPEAASAQGPGNLCRCPPQADLSRAGTPPPANRRPGPFDADPQ